MTTKESVDNDAMYLLRQEIIQLKSELENKSKKLKLNIYADKLMALTNATNIGFTAETYKILNSINDLLNYKICSRRTNMVVIDILAEYGLKNVQESNNDLLIFRAEVKNRLSPFFTDKIRNFKTTENLTAQKTAEELLGQL